MFRYALKSLRANFTRLIATALAVIVGIGFLAAGLMLTDAMRDGLTGTVEQQYAEVDLMVSTGVSGADMGFLQVVPAQTLDVVTATDGVAAASGEIAQNVRVKREDGSSANLRTIGRNWIADEAMNPLDLVDGRAPESEGEIALDAALLREAEASLGDTVGLDTPAGRIEAKIVGITAFGDDDAIDDGGTVSFDDATALKVLADGKGYQSVLVRTEGDSPAQVDEVADRLRAELGGNLTVETREQLITSSTEMASQFLDILRPVLSGFAYLAMFVAAFVIFNTFSVVVTQRFRELALIRAIGGTPAQVRRSLILEGLAIGVIASAVGIAAGALFSKLMQWGLGLFDITLPGSGVKITLGTIVVCMLTGTIVTVLSVIIPAFRAGRTKPVEAMRSSAIDTSGTSKVRAVFGAAFLIGAVVALVINQVAGPQWYYLAPGALFLFVGTFIGGPLLARVFAMGTRPLLGVFGLTGRLAADNSVRNPRRTATTANALVIGLFLVTAVTVSGEAFKTYVVGEFNQLSSSDFIVASTGAIPDDLVDKIDAAGDVRATAPIRSSAITNERTGDPYAVSTGDLDLIRETAGVSLRGDVDSVIDGSGVAIADATSLFGGSSESSAAPGASPEDQQSDVSGVLGVNGEMTGEVIPVVAADGSAVDLSIDAVLDGDMDTLFIGSYISETTFEQVLGDQPVNIIFVRAEPGKATEAGRNIEKAIGEFTGIEVLPGNFFGQIFSQIFDFLIGAVNGLLAMSIVVALVGIVNTMTLSIFERRRELGMVRALGMTRQQVGRMVRIEAVLIGLLGTIVGMGTGILLSWVLISSIDIGLSFNWARVGLIFLTGVLVGVFASLLPSRRATRLDMLEAMNSA